MKQPIMEQLSRLDYLLHRYYGHHGRDAGNPHRGQGRILAMLRLQPDISQRELSYLLDMRKQSLGELLAKLEHKGYIIRKPSEKDRRVLTIRLTEAGARAAEQMGRETREKKDIFAVLSEDEQAQLTGHLGRLIEALEAEVGADSPHHNGQEGRGGHGKKHADHGGDHGEPSDGEHGRP